MFRRPFLVSLFFLSSYCVVGAVESAKQRGDSPAAPTPESAPRPPLIAIQPAPEFSLSNVLGGEVKSSELKGKVVVVEMWATWATPSLAVMAEHNQLRQKLKDRGVEFLGVTFESGSAETVSQTVKQLQIEFPVVMGTPEVRQGFENFVGYPTTYLVGKDWKIYRRVMGYNPPNRISNLERDITALLAKPID